VFDRHHPQPGPVEAAGARQPLVLEPGRRGELTGVEQLRRELGNRRRHPVGHRQEDPPLRRHRLGVAQHVLQRGDAHAVGMTRLLRLIELLRVAQQHQAAAGRRHGQHVGE
jgi:hypothetical protein